MGLEFNKDFFSLCGSSHKMDRKQPPYVKKKHVIETKMSTRESHDTVKNTRSSRESCCGITCL